MIFKFLVAAAVAYSLWRLWHGFGRRPPGTPIAPQPSPRPGEAEARAVLGVGADADAAAIRAAHRRLVAGTHPDRGGSAELTRQLNAARDRLLREP